MPEFNRRRYHSTLEKMYRKLCILALFAIIGSTTSLPSALKRVSDSPVDGKCAKEVHITEAEVKEYNEYESRSSYIEKLACYDLCVAKKDGSINVDGVRKIAPYLKKASILTLDLVKKSWEKCLKKKTANKPCKTFYDTERCFREETIVFDLML